MRPEKKSISEEYLERLNASPFFLVAEYQGMNVLQFAELRKRLRGVGSEIHVVKNNVFRIAAKEVGVELEEALNGQLAVVTGEGEVPAAAKVVKNFRSEFDRPRFRFGYVEAVKYSADDLERLADLPPLDSLRSKLLGALQAPSQQMVRLLDTPASQMARVLQARVDKENG